MSIETFHKDEKTFESMVKKVDLLEIQSIKTLEKEKVYEWNHYHFKNPNSTVDVRKWKIEMVLFLTQKKTLDELPELDLDSNVFKFKINYKIGSKMKEELSVPFHYTLRKLMDEITFKLLYQYQIKTKEKITNELLWKSAKGKVFDFEIDKI